jgi:hypothetical protein
VIALGSSDPAVAVYCSGTRHLVSGVTAGRALLYFSPAGGGAYNTRSYARVSISPAASGSGYSSRKHEYKLERIGAQVWNASCVW